MPQPAKMPRKFLALITEAQESLQKIGAQSSRLQDELRKEAYTLPQVKNALHEIQIASYQAALNLSRIDVAADCTTCPASPPMTSARAYLLVLANFLAREATRARQHAIEGELPDDDDSLWRILESK